MFGNRPVANFGFYYSGCTSLWFQQAPQLALRNLVSLLGWRHFNNFSMMKF